MCDLWSGSAKYLMEAAECNDPLERFKKVITFSISSIYLCVGQNKPFNPLLGETHQGHFSNGIKFYCEHTSHHPPITNFLLEAPNGEFTLSGYYEITGKMGANHLISGLRGPNYLKFKDGHQINFGFPSYRLGGTVMGERSIEAIGCQIFEDITHNKKAVVCVSTFKKTGWIRNTSEGIKD